MTRETKIGLLTGLGVIILIGVLLSNYLGKDTDTSAPVALSSVGGAVRDQAQRPVVIPFNLDADNSKPEAVTALASNSSNAANALLTQLPDAGAVPNNAATQNGPATTVQPLSLAPATTLVSNMNGNGAPAQLISMNTGDNQIQTAATENPAPPATQPKPEVSGTKYAVVKGDNLSAIARKFYHSAKPANIDRIIQANTTVLKDAKAQLHIGEKLMIPDAPAVVAAGTDTPGVIITPVTDTPTTQPATQPAPQTVRPTQLVTYTVQKGDTLNKIAKRFTGSESRAVVRKIMLANKLDDSYLDVGETLRIPVTGIATRS